MDNFDIEGELAHIRSSIETLSGQLEDLFLLAGDRIDRFETETDRRFRRTANPYPGNPRRVGTTLDARRWPGAKTETRSAKTNRPEPFT